MTTLKTYTIQQTPDGDWEVTDGITGQDGYTSRQAAAYALRIASWGGGYPSPAQADAAIADGWTE